MKTLKSIALTVIAMLVVSSASAQEKKKIWVSGAARGIMYGDDYSTSGENDTTTARKTEGGHAMVDVGVNIQPNDKVLIQGMVRVRNDYGGFWGSGVTFDVRQLTITGVIGGFLKYQLGDIDYKLSPYTFNNNTALVNKHEGVLTSVPFDQVQYDLFYMPDNTWRQQGASIDFGLEFEKVLKEIQFDFFTTRILPSNFDTQDDRLYSGGSVVVRQSKNLNLGFQFANLYDFEGTSNNTVFLKNPVVTGSAEIIIPVNEIQLSAAIEGGRSTLEWEGSTVAPVLEDYFYDATLKADLKKSGVSVVVGYRDVGPNFRSAGAQTMQINFMSAPAAYMRYGNDQNLRQFGLVDLYRDASLYQTQIAAGLMAYDPRYDNATPYGRATPNRRGFSLGADYDDKKERWAVAVETELLSDVVGEGTSGLRDYNTTDIFARINFDKLLGWENRRLWVSGRTGMQNTQRDGEFAFEDVDLSTMYYDFNLTATLFGDLDVIAQYRQWQTEGNELMAERDEFSQVEDFAEYTIDYSEDIVGAGLQYSFSEESKIRLMWQAFSWTDNSDMILPYQLNTWSLFFTTKF